MKTLNILSFSLFLILHISIDLKSQDIPDHRTENYIPQERDFSQFPLNLNSNTTNTWVQLHPTIPRVDYWGVYFIDTVTGFAVGEGGALIKTIDGGLTWRTKESGVTTLLRTIGSYDGSIIVAAGDLGKIIISTDVGETWTELQSVVPHNLWNIQFVTDQIGWLVGVGSSALKTTDGGFTWFNIQTPLSGLSFWNVSFVDKLFGFICTQFGYVLRTTDGGFNWNVQQPVDNISLFAIKSVTPLRAIAMGQFGKKILTTNGGLSWNLIDFTGGEEFFQIAFLDTMIGYAVGLVQSYKTNDGGYSWNIHNEMVGGRDIIFKSNQKGFLVSRSMIINKTSNSGNSWFSLVINDDFRDVFFISESKGWFVGNALYETQDAGKTLKRIDDFSGMRPSSIYFLDSLIGFVGFSNSVFKTYNGGLNWDQKLISGMPGNASEFTRFHFFDENTGWSVSTTAGNRYVIKTIDGGDNWFFQFQGNSLTGIHFNDSNNGWLTVAGSGSSKPYKSTDGGVSWIEQVNFMSGQTYDVFFSNSTNGFVSGFSQLFKTNNGGLDWSPNGVMVGGGKFVHSKKYNYLFVTGGRSYKSLDNGDNWIELTSPNVSIQAISPAGIDVNYGVGQLGLIYRHKDSLILKVVTNNEILPERIELFQNFPNPFNSETLISFFIPKRAFVNVLVFDLSGRKICNLINNEVEQGYHSTQFDATNIASGIYIYTIYTNGYSESKRMVLTK